MRTQIAVTEDNHELAMRVGEELQKSPFTIIILIDEELFKDPGTSSKETKATASQTAHSTP